MASNIPLSSLRPSTTVSEEAAVVAATEAVEEAAAAVSREEENDAQQQQPEQALIQSNEASSEQPTTGGAASTTSAVIQQYDDGGEDKEITIDELVYGVDAFYAVVFPVVLTMTLAALSVLYINTPEFQAAVQEGLTNTYTVYRDVEDAGSTGKQLRQALVNALVMVSVICAMTFVIVHLYKYRCMKCLIGYMIFASLMLLGYLSAIMFQVAILRYNLTIDAISFWIFIFNFAIVGVASIFYQKGIPQRVTQFYLIISSVIVAWQLTNFDAWTGWLLLVMLALYDLFAVLTPCGPLKALVNLMHRENAPPMPGLLYEANIGTGTSSNNRPTIRTTTAGARRTTREGNYNQEGTEPTETGSQTATETTSNNEQQLSRSEVGSPREDDNRECNNYTPYEGNNNQFDEGDNSASLIVYPVEAGVERIYNEAEGNGQSRSEFEEQPLATFSSNYSQPSPSNGADYGAPSDVPATHPGENAAVGGAATFPDNNSSDSRNIDHGSSNGNGAGSTRNSLPLVIPETENADEPEILTGAIPLALAIRYRLPLIDDPNPRWFNRPSRSGESADAANNAEPEDVASFYTPEELQSLVTVLFPRRGGRILHHVRQRRNHEIRYAVLDSRGTLKRILFVNDEGVIYQDNREQNEREDRKNRLRERSSIKLGLGDFIFYSILVSKAAIYSYTTFIVCVVTIVTGLGLTLILLAVYKHALPALPISIALGITFYLLTRYLIEPWTKEIFLREGYV